MIMKMNIRSLVLFITVLKCWKMIYLMLTMIFVKAIRLSLLKIYNSKTLHVPV